MSTLRGLPRAESRGFISLGLSLAIAIVVAAVLGGAGWLYTQQDSEDWKEVRSVVAGVSFNVPPGTNVEENKEYQRVNAWSSEGSGLGPSTGLSIGIQKSEGAYEEYFRYITERLDGTTSGFERLRALPEGEEDDASNSSQYAYSEKVKNLTIDGSSAVQIYFSMAKRNSDAIRDETITWVRSGNINWYIVVQSAGSDPEVRGVRERVFNSIRFIR